MAKTIRDRRKNNKNEKLFFYTLVNPHGRPLPTLTLEDGGVMSDYTD